MMTRINGLDIWSAEVEIFIQLRFLLFNDECPLLIGGMFSEQVRNLDSSPIHGPVLSLAPMQDITDLAFMRVVAEYGGGPDYFVTEYFRVHPDSTPEKKILKSITENQTGRPVFAQMIGMDVPSLVRNSNILLDYDVAGMDINLGCPAPTVCRKDAGGGLLRNLDKVNDILGAMREICSAKGKMFTVKTRIGYETADEFGAILDVFARHKIDALAIHGRTVKDKYQTAVRDEYVKTAVERMKCPVMANGNVVNVTTGRAYHERTGAAGLMVGRGAIRSPWIFQQIRQNYTGEEVMQPTRRDLRSYIDLLFHEIAKEWVEYDEVKHVNKMKKYMIYIAQGIDAEFEHQIRRARSDQGFFEICDAFMDNDELLPDLPPENSKLFCGFKSFLD